MSETIVRHLARMADGLRGARALPKALKVYLCPRQTNRIQVVVGFVLSRGKPVYLSRERLVE
jgi:hypothetical protein